MYHLRIVAPPHRARQALALLYKTPSVSNVIHLPGAAHRPHGDVLLADVAREDTSLILSDLRELKIEEEGSIAIDEIDSSISRHSLLADEEAPSGSDAVVWEEIEVETSESADLSRSFIAFMILATAITSVGLLLNSPILVLGGMVAGPEFGPIAGVCVALVQRRRRLATRSALALAVGFPIAILVAFLLTVVFDFFGQVPDSFSFDNQGLAAELADPDLISVFVAACAGTIGVLSLTTAKSGPLIGVLISVATLPAAAATAIAAAQTNWEAMGYSMLQFVINLGCLLLCGTLTLWILRRSYQRRVEQHLAHESRAAAGLPVAPLRRSR